MPLLIYDSTYYCYDLRNGWISFNDTLYYDSARVKYYYSTSLDLVVGNDGVNRIYLNGVLDAEEEDDLSPQTYDLPSACYDTTGGAIASSLMDTSGLERLATGFSGTA